MDTLITKSIIKTKIAKQPVVVLPLKDWNEIEKDLEDVVMMKSKFLAQKIAKARKEKVVYSSKQVKTKLGI
ncbi:hypothetical protein KKB71_01670 [Patescibacteria group bacterium]|nr:hypothetical protein [Patescibacteria group bacterium]MBU2219492.1 hypothetical protein [Patescibacteria group bacterium]MBU2263082.1 hypothetical protein [Patescibacteria group bacterium]